MKTYLNIGTITIIIYTLSMIDSTITADWRYEICRDEPQSCGKGPNISYPFYVTGANNDFCGSKGFAIRCEENKPVYWTSRGPYIVEDISYQNNSFRLVDPEVANTTCVAPSHYFAFDGAPTKFLSTHANIQFFYGCDETFNPSFEISRTPCAINYTHPSFVALIRRDADLDGAIGCQKQVALPIDLEENQVNHTIKNVNYTQLLKDGFTLVWNESECAKCVKSGGICGSQEDNDNICLCPHGPELSICPAITADWRYEACREPKSCGKGPNISYPFYVTGANNDFCGRKGFAIRCEENKPVYWTSRGPYIVEDISYQNNSFRLVDPEVANTTCVAPSHYFAFDGAPTKFLSIHANIQFFYGCHKTFNPNFEISPTPCAPINSTHPSFVALIRRDADLDPAIGCQKQVALPIDLEENQVYHTIKNVNYTQLLKDGFTLVWNESECAKCAKSGGICGSQEDNDNICLCPHGPELSICPGHKDLLSLREKIVLVLAAVSMGSMVIILLICCKKNKLTLFWRKQDQTHQNVETFLRNYGPLQTRRYSYLDIKKMTNSFTDKLGQGGFGDVYKGKLDDECPVAVKVLTESKDNGEDFINEVATISRTSHVNIVTILGFCFEGSKRALIYEFMPNGSLEKFIFDESDKMSKPRMQWDMLYQIALGIARGLEYLHRGCNTRILHFDIKPHNILLDKDFTPKISDFGLAKICNREVSIISVLGARGTAGYIAPEVFSRNFGGISHKSDVYSYGMMVLEMVGGRKNINVKANNTSEIYFPHWIYNRLQLNELGLLRTMNEVDNEKVKKMIIVSLWCIQPNPVNRPQMHEVIEKLEGSLESLQLPPKPFLSSPPRAQPDTTMSTSSGLTLQSSDTLASSNGVYGICNEDST